MSRDLLALRLVELRLVAELDGTSALADDRPHGRASCCASGRVRSADRRGRGAAAALLDGRNSGVSGIAAGYAATIVSDWSRAAARRRGDARRPLVGWSSAWFNPILRAADDRERAAGTLALVVVLLLTSLGRARARAGASTNAGRAHRLGADPDRRGAAGVRLDSATGLCCRAPRPGSASRWRAAAGARRRPRRLHRGDVGHRAFIVPAATMRQAMLAASSSRCRR